MPTATVARSSREPDQASSDRAAATAASRPNPSPALAAAVLGFFIVTFDAVVVNVALPSIRQDFDAGITGLQWVVDGYTLMFAALLLWSGALTDRAGARRVFAAGIALFVAASAACGLAPEFVGTHFGPVRSGLRGGGDDAGVDGPHRPRLPRPSGAGAGHRGL